MNSKIYDIIKKHHLHPIGYQIKGKVIFLKEREHIYVIKLKTNNYDIYQYLLSHDFSFFPKNYSLVDDDYDISEYIETIKIDKDQKINELISILSLLHRKTSYKRKIDLDDIKKIYEEILEQVNHQMTFFLSLNDNIDNKLFLSPAEYLLIRNISLVYNLLNYAKIMLDKWYYQIQNMKSIRVCLLHNNISLEHFLIGNNKYLINWDKSSFDSPIYDIVDLYKKYYHNIELKDLFQIYERNNSLDDQEKKLLLIILTIKDNIFFGNSEIEKVKMLSNKILYWQKLDSYLKEFREKEK